MPKSHLQLFTAYLIVGLVSLFYLSFLSHKVNLVTADLGRHLRNGELAWQNREVLSKNFYSYTEADFPVINHHWGSGLIFYGVWKFFGFLGLQIFFLVTSLATFLILFSLASKKSTLAMATAISWLTIPLLAERIEIRPEIFSYLFAAIFFWLLVKFRGNPNVYKFLFLLPAIQILWVNLHVFFILGPALVGAFLLESLIFRRGFAKKLLLILALLSLATLINPFGIKGLTEPFVIFQEYGIQTAEHQTLLFKEKILANPNFLLFKIVFVILCLSFLAAWFWRKNRSPFPLAEFLAGISFGILAWLQIRHITLFAFFSLPILATNFHFLLPEKFKTFRAQVFAALLGLGIFSFILSQNYYRKIPGWTSFGWGLEKANEASAKFFKENQVQGPIFNNFDIGGYLIFYLSPQDKVFVDNRPEAYSVDFFKNTYLPMLIDEQVWKAQLEKYQFNSVFFHRLDPLAQKFLAARVRDSAEWAPVFGDQYAFVFVRRVNQNQSLIQNFEIPQSRFTIIEPE